ncbi:hypothetical protein M5K25_004394 [Dendrobium thyrsiflorum]|uniref:Uncharacterized protein n=1 Tax=Dendrobium thyrsiflorum TaxID=117978 RepID=A0ABD0VMH5_DENTH
MRGAKGRPVLRDLERAKLGLPLALFFCLLFFFAGFFGSMFVSKDFLNFGRVRRVSLMELSEVDDGAVEPATQHRVSREAESGIPFQILSWRPRAVYFPKFATLEQCRGIIKNSRSKLSPSTLALRDGETAENTKGIRTSTGAFISNSDDSSGTLNELEEKIARVTMIPRSQGEDFYILRYQIGQRKAKAELDNSFQRLEIVVESSDSATIDHRSFLISPTAVLDSSHRFPVAEIHQISSWWTVLSSYFFLAFPRHTEKLNSSWWLVLRDCPLAE